jgi:hypothetical protein
VIPANLIALIVDLRPFNMTSVKLVAIPKSDTSNEFVEHLITQLAHDAELVKYLPLDDVKVSEIRIDDTFSTACILVGTEKFSGEDVLIHIREATNILQPPTIRTAGAGHCVKVRIAREEMHDKIDFVPAFRFANTPNKVYALARYYLLRYNVPDMQLPTLGETYRRDLVTVCRAFHSEATSSNPPAARKTLVLKLKIYYDRTNQSPAKDNNTGLQGIQLDGTPKEKESVERPVTVGGSSAAVEPSLRPVSNQVSKPESRHCRPTNTK